MKQHNVQRGAYLPAFDCLTLVMPDSINFSALDLSKYEIPDAEWVEPELQRGWEFHVWFENIDGKESSSYKRRASFGT